MSLIRTLQQIAKTDMDGCKGWSSDQSTEMLYLLIGLAQDELRSFKEDSKKNKYLVLYLLEQLEGTRNVTEAYWNLHHGREQPGKPA